MWVIFFFKESKITHFEEPMLCVPDGLQSCLCGADLDIAWSPGDHLSLITLFMKVLEY